MQRSSPDTADQDSRAPVRRAEAILAAAGLRAVRVEHCPDAACPVCARSRRAAA